MSYPKRPSFMSTARLSILLLLASLITPFLKASPLISIGDSVHIYFVGQTSFEYDSNIFLNYSNKDDDFIFSVTPGFNLVAGGDSDYKVSLTVQEEGRFYTDHRELDEANEIVNLNASYDGGGQLKLGLNAGYRTLSQNTSTANVSAGLIRRRNYNLGFQALYSVSPKTQLEFNPSWFQEDYRNFVRTFNDRDYYTLPINFYYLYSPKLKFGVGYRYRYTDLHKNDTPGNSPADRSDHFVNLRLDGEIGPRLQSTTAIGWQFQHINGFETYSSLSVSSRLTWEATQRMQVSAGLNRDFSASGTGNAIQNTGGDIGITFAVSEKISTSAGFSYGVSDYKNIAERDDLLGTYLRMTYIYNKYLNFNAGYTYQNNDSEIQTPFGTTSAASYNVHRVSMTANLKY